MQHVSARNGRRSVMTAFAGLLVAASASAGLYVQDPVATSGTGCYTVAGLAGQSATNSTLGVSSAWGTGTAVFTVDALGLAYPETVLLDEAGGSFAVMNTSTTSTDGRILTRPMSGIPTSGTYYFSMLLRAASGFTAALADGHAVGLGMGTNALSGVISTPRPPSTGVYFGFQNSGGARSLMLRVSGTNYPLVTDPVADQTYLCVAKVERGAAPGGEDIVWAAVNPVAPDIFTLSVTNSIVASGAAFTHMAISGTYRTNGKKGYFDEFRIGSSWMDVAPLLDDTYPAFNNPPTLSLDATNAFVFSATLDEGTADTAVIACYGTSQGSASADSWDHSKLVTGASTLGIEATTVLDNLATNTCYYYAALATNANHAVLKSGDTFMTGEVWLETGADAQEEGLVPGHAVLRRPASATQAPLTVNYTVSGTAVEGVNYVSGSLSGTITIPAEQDSASIPVRPLVEIGNLSDTTVILTLAEGAYFIGGNSTATVTIRNYDFPADKNVWVATAPGNASVAANWSQNRVPTASDAILLDLFSTADMTWDVDGGNGLPDRVASWTQSSNYTGTVTFPIQYTNVVSAVFTNFTVAGSAAINGGAWTHPSNTTAQAFHLRVTVGGDFAVGSAAKVDAQGRGYGINQYPAGGTAGVHGGARGNFANVYGDVYRPADIGAGCWAQTGGGAVWLDVAGDATVDGTVSARPADKGVQTDMGAGGSVYIRTRSLSGIGAITVAGNGYYNQVSGSGGRIAVELTDAETLGMDSANFAARGGWGNTSAGAGTILIKTAAQPHGTLIVDNSGVRNYGCQPPNKYGTTCVTAGKTWTFDAIVFRNTGILSIPEGTTLNLPNGFPSVSSLNPYPQSGILYMGGNIEVGAATPYTFMSNWVFQADSPYTLTGNVSVCQGGTLGCMPLVRNTLSAYAGMDLTVVGDLDVAADGKISADNAGVDTPSSNATKGYHGGLSAAESTDKSYDSVLSPALPGFLAQSGDAATIRGGGGAVRLTVTGNLNVDGPVSSTSARGSYWPGAGGAINIRAGTLTGAGSISANGGAGSSTGYAGGGGRVAVRLTDADATFEAFGEEDISASGVSSSSASPAYLSSAGTVYLQTAADSEGAGRVIIRNDNSTANTNAVTWFPSTRSGGEADVLTSASLVIGGCANVRLSTNSVKMVSMSVETNARLDLNGQTLLLQTLEVGGARYGSGTYTAAQFPAGVLDSSAEKMGLIVVRGKGGTVITIL